jgi:hypothetical protein
MAGPSARSNFRLSKALAFSNKILPRSFSTE